jgi:hypothetical protein
MIRRLVVPMVVIAGGALFGVLGLYLGSQDAAVAASSKTPGPALSSSDEIRQLQKRIASLESRIEALEKPQPRVWPVIIDKKHVTPSVPQEWPDDGFNKPRTIHAR